VKSIKHSIIERKTFIFLI